MERTTIRFEMLSEKAGCKTSGCDENCRRREVLSSLLYHGYSDKTIFDFQVIFLELCRNAHEHGNNFEEGKRVFLTVDIDEKKINLSVCDEGKGFDPTSLECPIQRFTDFVSGKSFEEDETFESGRGIFLVRALADSLHFKNGGSEVSVILKNKRGFSSEKSVCVV